MSTRQVKKERTVQNDPPHAMQKKIVSITSNNCDCDALRKVTVFNFCLVIVDYFEPSFRKSSEGLEVIMAIVFSFFSYWESQINSFRFVLLVLLELTAV